MSRSGWWIKEYERGRARRLGEADAVRAASMGETVGRDVDPDDGAADARDVDPDDGAETRRQRQSTRCKCGYPDWPGSCPVHGENKGR